MDILLNQKESLWASNNLKDGAAEDDYLFSKDFGFTRE